MSQKGSPKDQYLLLKALNEAIMSLATLQNSILPPSHQQEAAPLFTILVNIK